MTRIDPPEPVADVKPLLAALPDLGLFRVVARAPTVLGPWLNLGGALLDALELDPALRELAILQTAVTLGCDYERDQHESIARGIGVPQRAIDQVLAGLTDDPTLLAVTELLDTRTLAADSFAAMVERLGERQTVELLLVVGYYSAAALLISAVDLDPDAPADTAVLDAARGPGSPV